nr:MAG TPA: hypothetical protein [Caudoviricetes sp.]DAQ28586.1 MAG TPA: hypothetical protein [Caudoviricetes sp.]DAR67519.1 MAG TPA: hypothetical protein [Caudoviricetes sp.]
MNEKFDELLKNDVTCALCAFVASLIAFLILTLVLGV